MRIYDVWKRRVERESRKPEAFTTSVVRAHPSNGFQDPDEAEAETADSGQAAEEGGGKSR